MPKAEISWKRSIEGGTKMEVNARRAGGRWIFYIRERRYEQWNALTNRLWKTGWNAAGCRAAQDCPEIAPSRKLRVKKSISELFPGTDF
jgi:hypothetical protein